MLTRLKVSFLLINVYFTDENIIQRGESMKLNFEGLEMQKLNIPTDKAQMMKIMKKMR